MRGCVNEAALREEFDGVEMHADGPMTVIDVELLDGAKIYDLIDALRRSDCVIESIDRREPNLGDVFLRIVRGEVVQ